MKQPSPKSWPTLPPHDPHRRPAAPVAALRGEHAPLAAAAEPEPDRRAPAPVGAKPPAGEPDQRPADGPAAAHRNPEAEAGQHSGLDPARAHPDADPARIRARGAAVGALAAA